MSKFAKAEHSNLDNLKDELIILSEPLKLLTILPEEYEERNDWLTLGKLSLARAYSDDEPEYGLDSIKELNTEYQETQD